MSEEELDEELDEDLLEIVDKVKDIKDPEELMSTLKGLLDDNETNYIKIGEHRLTFDDAFNIKRSVDDMIKEWDFMIRKEIPFNDDYNIPLTMCSCGFNAIVPIDYYIDKSGHVVMCGQCKNCGKYKEFTDLEMSFPFPFKEPPKERGIMFKTINNRRDDRDMFI